MSVLVETMDRIRAERKRLRSFPNFEEGEEGEKEGEYKGKNDNSGIAEDRIENAIKSDNDIVNDDNDIVNDDNDTVNDDNDIVNDDNSKDGNIANSNKRAIENSKKSLEILKETGGIDKLLARLKRNEPSSDNQFFRMSIIAYEMGDLHRSIVYAARFKNDDKARLAHLANGKLALADALTQLYLLCLSLDWDFNGLRELGVLHLQERQEDFKRDGWSEVK